MKINEFGRSMVEMLGVLAIIGVLSVGAIAGYPKAMFKYKLNKHAESFNILINNTIQYRSNLSGSGYDSGDTMNGGLEYYAEFFKKLNLIPEGMKVDDSQYISDNFGNLLWIYKYKNLDWVGMGINIESSYRGQDICANIVKVTKENHTNIRSINMQNGETQLYGDSYCDADKKCLAKLTLSDIDALCNTCEGQCTLYISMPV